MTGGSIGRAMLRASRPWGPLLWRYELHIQGRPRVAWVGPYRNSPLWRWWACDWPSAPSPGGGEDGKEDAAHAALDWLWQNEGWGPAAPDDFHNCVWGAMLLGEPTTGPMELWD